uniref:Uncharacterized protein n=1 Tax=Anguilla anguilla TaxID=7936 RepID=A0A0E9VY47_ANGAN
MFLSLVDVRSTPTVKNTSSVIWLSVQYFRQSC